MGSMYVSESGVAGPGAGGITHTGKVDKFAPGNATPSWSTGFNSVYLDSGRNVLGPEGITAMGNGCMKQSKGQRNGCQVLMVTSESTPGLLAEPGGAINDPQAGRLFRLDGATGAATERADVGSQMYQWTTDNQDVFPDDFPDANPYAVLVMKDPVSGAIRTFVADAAANTILEIMADGTARIIAYIPNETAPPFRDATPTCIAAGPEGYLYVGTLHLLSLFVLGQTGRADVWRVAPNANYPAPPTPWASGLTTATACTFDQQGNFWATEMFAPTSGAP